MRVEPRLLLVLVGAFLVPACGGGGGGSQAPDAGTAVGIATITGPEANQTGLGGGRLGELGGVPCRADLTGSHAC